ncbi:MAG: carboxypeptidase-like regulatory domain-containing protein, partial [Bacteroidota bacterium]
MKLNLMLLITLLFVSFNELNAQKVKLFGKIIDKETGEELIGAYVVLNVVEEQKGGTSTDIDGTYALEIEPGLYEITVSYVSYNDLKIKDVLIKEGENYPLDVALSSSTEILTEVVVTAEAVKNTDAALITLQRKSFSVQDGISSRQIARTGSSNAAEAMKQMTGAVVEDGKFVVMRGLGDRYSLAQLNGITLPSADPYRNSSSLDII